MRYGQMLWRGLRKRCGRCGTGGLFRSYFHMVERCPGCGYKFDREEGFFTGAFLVNFAVTEGLLVVVMVVLIIVLSGDPHTNIAPLLGAGIAAAVLAPIVFYPHARSLWAALDLAMRPLEPVEEAEALLAVTDPEDDDPDRG